MRTTEPIRPCRALALLALSALACNAPASGASKSKGEPTRTPEGTLIVPFKAQIPDAALADLRRRLEATRWPDKETVPDRSQGVPREKLQALVAYWGKDYDWRKAEARFNALPQFLTKIDGVDIQFAHIKSKEKH